MNPHRLQALFFLLIVTAIWGAAEVVIKFTLGGFPPIIFLTYRFAISAILAIGFFAFYGIHFPRNFKVVLLILFYGFLTSTVALGFLFLGIEKTTAIDASLISTMTPIITAIAGAIFLREHVTLREKIGIGIAFLGTLITILEPVLRNGDGFSGLEGNLLVFASILVGVATAVMAKILMRDEVDPLFVTNLSFIVGFATILPLALSSYTPMALLSQIKATSWPFHLGVIYMAVLSGTIAYALWHKAQKTIEIGEVGVFTYLYPVFATPLAVVFLKEKITTPFIVGAVVIALGVAIAEIKKTRYNSSSRGKKRR